MRCNQDVARTSISGIITLCAVLGLSACATWKDSAQSQLNDARTVIDSAKAAGAEQHAPELIRSADTYVSQAQEFIGMGKFESAARATARANASAELATVQAASGDRDAQIQALRQEIANLTR